MKGITQLLDAIPNTAPLPPEAQYDVRLEKELVIKNPALAVKTQQGMEV